MSHRLRKLGVFIITLGCVSVAVSWQSAPRDDAKELLPVLRQNGIKYWKGNLHTHSLWSDGDDFPEMIADWYVRHGYHFLGMSDHNILAEGVRWIDVSPKK